MPYTFDEFVEVFKNIWHYGANDRIYMKIGNVMYPVNKIYAEKGEGGKPSMIILDSEIIETHKI